MIYNTPFILQLCGTFKTNVKLLKLQDALQKLTFPLIIRLLLCLTVAWLFAVHLSLYVVSVASTVLIYHKFYPWLVFLSCHVDQHLIKCFEPLKKLKAKVWFQFN